MLLQLIPAFWIIFKWLKFLKSSDTQDSSADRQECVSGINGLMFKQILLWIMVAAIMILIAGWEVGGTIALLTSGVALAITIPLICWWKSSIVEWVKQMKTYEESMEVYQKKNGRN